MIKLARQTIDIKTDDGRCDTYLSHPADQKNRPVVFLYMDAIGLRQRIFEMADRLASSGYCVLAPNLFYRSQRIPIVDYESLLNPERLPELFQKVMPMVSALSTDMAKRDTEGFLNFVKMLPQASSTKIGLVGYCFGGGQALRAAGNFPTAFRAVASFHAGNLVSDAESSPHKWFPQIKAEVYVGHADLDRSMPPEQIEKVALALKAAGVPHQTELYQGCAHVWTMSDVPAFNKDGERQHWERLEDLFRRNLLPDPIGS